jgi:peptidoglycan/xylan/chitin deacetylase (PgdA/CDA1 family)
VVRLLTWLWVAALAALSVAVLTARSEPIAQPEPTSLPTPTSTARPLATPTTRAIATQPAKPALRATATPTPSATVVGKATVRKGAVVALTFDAGADRGYAEDILDLLRSQRIKADFGITGQWAKQNPDLVRRMAADGHLVFNHTLDHRSFTGASDGRGGLNSVERRAQLSQADAIIAPLIGHSTRPWYRLPYGDDDAGVAADLVPAGYTRKVGWTVDTLGWRGASASDIVERSLRLAAPNAIYVMHVGRGSQDGPALARIVTALLERGYGFVSVEQLPR